MRCMWLLAVLCLFLLPVQAFADSPRLYVSLSGGMVYPIDNDAGLIEDLELDSGSVFGGAVGLDYGQGRLELEGFYRKTDVDRFKLLGVDYDGGGEVESFAMMANAIYTMDNPTSFHPFFLFGVGGATIDLSNITAGNVKVVDADDFQFAYQGGAGVEMLLGESFRVGVEYRYFQIINEEFKDGAGNTFDYGYRAHNAMVSARLLF